MLENLKHVYKEKIVLFAGVIGLVSLLGFTLVPTVNVNASTEKQSERRHCRVQNSAVKSDWYGGGFFNSKEYKVPSSSECLDINVRNIYNTDPTIPTSDKDKYCAYFKVAMYPSDVTKPI